MFIEKIKTPGLSHLSYFVASKGKACVIDPRRDTEKYLQLATDQGVRISHIFETHRNEDLVSGAALLADASGATVYHGAHAEAEIEFAETATEGTRFDIGDITIEVLETPGHTRDSVSFLLTDNNFDTGPVAVFTGDALFIGDVGRTDFYPDNMAEMAGLLYDSLQKLRRRAADALLYPAHGAGSVCGDGMADREFSTVAHEFAYNPLLLMPSKAAFVERKLHEHHEQPPYFRLMEQKNTKGDSGKLRQNQVLDWHAAMPLAQNRGAVLLDLRDPEAFVSGHLPGSFSVPQAMVTAYVGWLFHWQEPLVVIGSSAAQIEAGLLDLYRIGYDNIQGCLQLDGFAHAAMGRPTRSLALVDAAEVDRRCREDNNWTLLDVRKLPEFEQSHIDGARHVFLGELRQKLRELDPEKPITVMCQSGKRATIGAAILQQAGFAHVDVFRGSMGAWSAYRR